MDSGSGYRLVVTDDGSHTVRVGENGVTFHSTKGALTESRHIFMGYGLRPVLESIHGPVSILEIGFGTGLNALLTLLEAGDRSITYDAIEPHPLPESVLGELRYADHLTPPVQEAFEMIHRSPWDKWTVVGNGFRLRKTCSTLDETKLTGPYDLVFFDPFDPEYQPELWTQEVFERLFLAMARGAILVTYSSKGVVRRAMESVGFQVERLQGPPGKRHVTRAVKPWLGERCKGKGESEILCLPEIG